MDKAASPLFSFLQFVESQSAAQQDLVYVFGSAQKFSRYRKKLDLPANKFRYISSIENIGKERPLSVVFNDELDDKTESTMISFLISGMPVMLGPAARDCEIAWKMKPAIEASGGILEIAGSEKDFPYRLRSTLTAAVLQNHIKKSYWKEYFSAAFQSEFAHSVLSTDATWPMETSKLNELLVAWASKKAQRESHLTSTKENLATLPGVMAATKDLRDSKSGRLDADRIATLFVLTRAKMAMLLGVTPQALAQTPDSERHQTKLGQFERVAVLRMILQEKEDFPKWLQTPNPELGNKPPIDLLLEGKASIVADLVSDIITNRVS